MAVGGADQEARLTLSRVPPAFEVLCEFGRRQCPAPLIEDDGNSAARQLRDLAAAVGKLGDLGRPGNPLQIAIDQIGLRRATDLSARDDVKQHYLEKAGAPNGQVNAVLKPS